jgi:type III restriction enzyme
VVHKYRPDFLVRLVNGEMLILETKGQETEQDQVKRAYLDEWIEAVNAQSDQEGFGRWQRAMTRQPGEIRDILAQVPLAFRQ